MKKALIFSLLVALSSSTMSVAQRPPTEQEFSRSFDTYIQLTMSKLPDLPGVAIAVVKDDRAIFVKTYGAADMATGLKADNDTLFYIASSTKSYMALAAALLDREGK